jgi:AcrR family transcriptional regulator
MRPVTADTGKPTGRAEVVEAILDTADRLFAVDAPGDVSLRGIAREAGVNHGLVYRHFGTRDDLIDKLLERTADRWAAALESTPDFDTALDSILGSDESASRTAGTWLRLLTWSLLTDTPRLTDQTQSRGAVLDRLPGLLPTDDEEEAAIVTAAALALVYGWRFFHPYIRAALHLEDVPFARLHDEMRAAVHRLAAGDGHDAP